MSYKNTAIGHEGVASYLGITTFAVKSLIYRQNSDFPKPDFVDRRTTHYLHTTLDAYKPKLNRDELRKKQEKYARLTRSTEPI